MNQSEKPTILFAGGGTGGHLFPNIAIAERVIARVRDRYGIHFAVSDRRIDQQIMDKSHLPYTPLPVQPLYLKKPMTLPGFAMNYLRSKRLTQQLIDEQNVRAIVATGGFVSGPVVVTARQRGLSCFLINLDAIPGKANRWLWPKADRVFSVFEQTGLPLIEVIDMPLRQAALAPRTSDDPDEIDQSQARQSLDLDPTKPTLLITGASQGATSINRLTAALLGDSGFRDALKDWQILHLAGHGAAEEMRAAYASVQVPVRVIDFLDEMGLAWGAATLAISRAGAGSVAEIRHNRVPALLFPYPYHADRHQWHNAQPLAEADAAIILDDHIDPAANLRAHRDTIVDLLLDLPRIEQIRENLCELPASDGADEIAAALLDSLG